VTPADKSGSTGQNPEGESERTSGVATDSQEQPAEEAAEETPDGNGSTTSTAGQTASSGTTGSTGSAGGPSEPAGPSGSAGSTGAAGSTAVSAAFTGSAAGSVSPTGPAAGSPGSGGPSGSAGSVGSNGFVDEADKAAAESPTGRIPAETAAEATAAAPEAEPSHGGTPPPWQRVPNEPASGQPAKPATSFPSAQQPGQRTMPVMPGAGEATVAVERPVVTGAAAARLFAEGTPTASTVAGQNRTTVHLDGSNPSAGPLRMGAAAAPSALRRPGRGPRRANLQIKRFDPWSVLKLSLVLSVALFFVWLVAVGVLYAVLNGMGVWDKLNGISSEILQPADGGGEPLISAGRVFGVAAIIGAVNIVLFSALATVGAFIYNVSADLAGGLEVTLAERE